MSSTETARKRLARIKNERNNASAINKQLLEALKVIVRNQGAGAAGIAELAIKKATGEL